MTSLDKLYFIVDASGNYYRINNKDQLIMTKDRNEADVFSFMEANKRIGSGKKAHFYSVIPAEENEADEYVEEVKDMTVKEDNAVPNIAEVKSDFNYDLSQIDWTEYLNNFCHVASSLKNYHDELNNALSDIDLKICDVMHYVELYQLSDEESIKAVNLLKKLREKRRQIKDEMFRADNIQKGIGTSANVAKAKDCIKQIGKLESRVYTPRKLNDLFAEHLSGEKGQVSTETKKNINQVFDTDKGNMVFADNEENISKLIKYKTKQEDMTEMCKDESIAECNYERRETVYDGRKNDWKQFARMQLEFFENAKQHLYNLEDDLDDIEDEIEDILILIEDANYNVAQGYKVFKRLKDLRNDRREKLQELDCLDALTESFDCEAMAEVYRESLQVIEDVIGKSKETSEVIGMAG